MNSGRLASVCLWAALGIALCSAETAVESASFFQRCARNATVEEINDCLDNAIEYAIRNLNNGLTSLGLPKLDPLNLAQVTLNSSSGATLNLLNYDVNGLSDAIVFDTSFTTDGTTYGLKFDVLLPQFDAAGSYVMEKGFLGNKKPNEGAFTFNLTGYTVDFVLEGTLETKDDQQYLNLKGVSSNFMGGLSPKVWFENLSEGRNAWWNANPQGILASYKAAIDQVHPVLSSTFANLIFSQIPFDVIFPENL